MAPPTRRDLDLTAKQLASWLSHRLEGATGVEIGLLQNAVSGFSNETILFEASWTQDGRQRSEPLVLRIQPSEFCLYYQAPEFFESQFRLLEALGSQSSVPVPKVLLYEEDTDWLGAAFFLMERVSGRILADVPPYFAGGWLHDSEPQEQRDLWMSAVKTVATVNTLDWRAAGLDFLPDAADPGFDARLRYCLDAFEWAREGSANPIVEQVRDWLVENRPDQTEPAVLSWGDTRLGNLVFNNFEPVAVLDWEMASLGPPQQDIAWWLFVDRAYFGDLHTGDPRDPRSLPGLPSREETLKHWAHLTGFSIDYMDFYEVFAGFRMAVVLQRMGTLFKRFGVVGQDSRWPANNVATQALAAMIGIPHPDPEPMPNILTS